MLHFIPVDRMQTLRCVSPSVFTTHRFVPTRPEHKAYSFGGYGGAYPQTLFQTQSRLNEMGQAVSEFDLSKVRSSYATLTVESAVRDDRGKYVAATRNREIRWSGSIYRLKTTGLGPKCGEKGQA